MLCKLLGFDEQPALYIKVVVIQPYCLHDALIGCGQRLLLLRTH